MAPRWSAGPRVSPSPSPISACGAIVHASSAEGSSASPTSPPAIEQAPGRRLHAPGRRQDHGPVAWTNSAASGTTDTVSAATAGERPQPSTSRSTSRNSAAVSAAESSTSVTFGPIAGRSPGASDRRDAANRERGRDRQYRDGHLHHEDRLPGEGLGEQPADDRSGRRTDHTRRDPAERPRAARRSPRPAAPGSRRVRTHRRAPARSEPRSACPSTRLSAHTAEAPANTAIPTAHSGAGSRPPYSQCGRDDHEREHEVERDQHPRHLGDRSAQVLQDLGQRERDDRRVGEHERHGQREQRNDGPAHRLIVTCQAFGSCSAGGFGMRGRPRRVGPRCH